MSLRPEIIITNKARFIELLRNNIKREGADIEGLINKLENSDFFSAPASTQYHNSFEGGLCAHCLNVYDQLINVVKSQFTEDSSISNETITIVSLLHDLSKMNFYETSMRNVKDENGNWTKVPFIKVREKENRFIYSDHGTNSEYMVGRFIPLSIEESAAIIHHMGWSDEHTNSNTISQVFERYPLALYLHIADCLATYVNEKVM
ncbi:hydrolase [uncultured Clostridium sp.]|uniref:hydrolase n=1 Tax=uncultured Clostridium sp. TaxID=59620 RepID=UPI0026322E06|nr:hydrolase [uncultured Clostridium sp.]